MQHRHSASFTFLSAFSRFRLDLASLLILLVCFTSLPLKADDQSAQIDAIRQLLQTTQPDMQLGSIVPSPIDGLFEVSIQGGQTIFVSSDAHFLIPGDLYEATSNGLVNLGDVRRNELRKEKIAAVDEKSMIIYPAIGESKATVTVFTDVDCPYCRKLHAEVEELNTRGITVRYLAYPRTGLNTEIHRRMISIWCSPDRNVMFTSAKRGGDVPEVNCDNPVADQFRLGQEVGVTGTPALVFDDGTIVPGYIPAETLAGYLLGDAGL